MGIPTGWKDDGTTLTAPNGVPVVMGFRGEIINGNWNPDNVPEAKESHADQILLHNANVGGGQVQFFRDSMLWWTQAQGVVNEQELGIELFLLYQKVAALEAQIAAGSPPPSPAPAPIPADLQSAINQAETTLQSAADALKPYVK